MAAGWPKQNDNGDNNEGSRAARLLHMARRAERNLLSYERAGKNLGNLTILWPEPGTLLSGPAVSCNCD